MRFNKIYLIGVFLILICCSEEGPIEVGDIGISYTVTCTPQTASILLTERENDLNSKYISGSRFYYESLYCSDTLVNLDNFSKSYNIFSHYQVKFIEKEDNSLTQKNKKFFFTNQLSPEKQYYLYSEQNFNLNYPDDTDMYFQNYYKYLGSFKTPKEGDYSELGETKCQLVRYWTSFDYLHNVIVKITLPPNVYRDSDSRRVPQLYASSTEGMSNPIIGQLNSYRESTSNELYFEFDKMERGEYFFEYRGDIKLYESDSDTCYDYNFEINAIIKVENSIDLSDLK